MTADHKRHTQTAEYWTDLIVDEDDLTFLYERLLEVGKPQTIDDLARALVEQRIQQEEERLSQRAGQGQVYQPHETYEVGQRLVFPAFDYAVGEVVSIRDGNNPRYGSFRVVGVRMEDGVEREFASELTQEHALSRRGVPVEEGEEVLTAEQLYGLYGEEVKTSLRESLEQNPDFIRFEDQWFLRGQVPTLGPYHLNIAEAMIFEQRTPLTISELLRGFEDIELPESLDPATRAYALTYALSEDPRFIKFGMGEEPTWYLRDLVPEAVQARPARLIPLHRATGGEWLSRELHDFVLEIGDEADEIEATRILQPASANRFEWVLIYPHLREGTFPLPYRARGILPDRAEDRYTVTIIDADSKEEMAGWMLPGEGYGWGLGEWYEKREVPVGGILVLRPGDAPNTFVVQCGDRKRRSDWTREAKVVDGRVTFSMQRRAFTCKYDKYLVLAEGNRAEMDEVWMNTRAGKSLFVLLTELFPELAKLSGQGLVHAKTLYSAVNLTRRSGAVPIFAELTRHACFDPIGDGNWVYNEALRDVVYETPEDMSKRPRSPRQNLVVSEMIYRYGMRNEVWSP